jgi:hypothetical protein
MIQSYFYSQYDKAPIYINPKYITTVHEILDPSLDKLVLAVEVARSTYRSLTVIDLSLNELLKLINCGTGE